MIFWIDNTSIYDCRTYSLIKPQQYDVSIILDYIKQEQQYNRIDLKDKLPKLLKTLSLLLMIHNKNEIFRLLQILASKDFQYTKLFNDFMNSPAALWYLEKMKVESVQMVMHQYIQGEYKFLEGLFLKITNSYEQYQQKFQNELGTPEFNQQTELQIQQNQDQIKSNKFKDKLQQNQIQDKQITQISQEQLRQTNDLRRKNSEENNLEKEQLQILSKGNYEIQTISDTFNQNDQFDKDIIQNKEQIQKQNQEFGQQQEINKERITKTIFEVEDQSQQQQQLQNDNKQKLVHQEQSKNLQITKIQKDQNNPEIQKGCYFSELQKVSLEQVCKDDQPDQKMLDMAKILSEKVLKKSGSSPSQSFSKFKPNPKPLEKITEKVEKKSNIEQKIANKINQEPEKINQYIDTLTEKEQQEFQFSEDTELIKLFDLLKEKCEQTHWWSKFQDKCHKAMIEKELEMIMFEKLPLLMKRWAEETGKNVTELEQNPNRGLKTQIQEIKNTLLDYSDPEELTKDLFQTAQSIEKIDKNKQYLENEKFNIKVCQNSNQQNNLGINKLKNFEESNCKLLVNKAQKQSTNQNQKNDLKDPGENQLILNSKQLTENQEQFNKENQNFIFRLDEDPFFNQSQQILIDQEQLLQNEIQDVTPYQIIDLDDDEILLKNIQVDNQKVQQSKVIKTVSIRLNTEINNKRQQDVDIHSTNDEINSNKKSNQQLPQQQPIQINDDCIEIQNQSKIKNNIICSNIQSDVNQINDNIDNLFQNESPDSMISSSILISEQSSIQLEEIQVNKNQFENKEQLNQQKQKEIIKVIEKKLQKNEIKQLREEEQQQKEKKQLDQDLDLDIKEKQQNKNNNKSKKTNENQKVKSKGREPKNDQQEKIRAKSSQQNKEKNIETKKKKSIEKKNTKEILKTLQTDQESKEKQKEDFKIKEKVHSENIKKAEQTQDKLRNDESKYQKEQQISKQKEIEAEELKKQQYQNQYKKYQQPSQQPQQHYNHFNQIQENTPRLKSQEKQIQEPKIMDNIKKFQHQNQQIISKMQDSQSNENQPQQLNQAHEKLVQQQSYHKIQNNQNLSWEQQAIQKTNPQNYNQFDRHQYIQQNQQEQLNLQQNLYERQNSQAFPLEQYGIQESLTKKDQKAQKNIIKSVVNPVQYDLVQQQSSLNQGNDLQYHQHQQYQNQQQFQLQQQYQQQQQQFQQQKQFFNPQKPREKKFRNKQSSQQDFYRQKQQFQNQQESHSQKQRKYNHSNGQHSINQNFNYISPPSSNINVQPYPFYNQMNEHQFLNQNPYPHPNSINPSNQPSKKQMFEIFCQMFQDKFQQSE